MGHPAAIRIRLKPALRYPCDAVGSVACLEWVWWIIVQAVVLRPQDYMLSLFETIFAKEAKKCLQLLRKTPRPVAFTSYAYAGLQCVLSGNQVAQMQ